jgi:hypothetical protein
MLSSMCSEPALLYLSTGCTSMIACAVAVSHATISLNNSSKYVLLCIVEMYLIIMTYMYEYMTTYNAGF